MGNENLRFGGPTALLIDGVDIGLIAKDGIDLAPANVQTYDARSSGRMGKTRVYRAQRDWTLKFKAQEMTLATVAMIHDLPAPSVGVLSATESNILTSHTIAFIAPGPDGKTWLFEAEAGVFTEPGSIMFSDTQITEPEITIDLLDVYASGSRPFTLTESTTTTTAPTFTASPTDNATDVAVTANVTFSVSNAIPLLPSTVNTANCFIIEADGTAPVAAAVTYNASTKVITINPTASLDTSTEYSAVLTPSVKSLYGVSAAGLVVTFTTAS